MADDIVSFGMEIDSSAARKAREDLMRLANAGPEVERGLNKVAQGGKQADSALGRMAAQAQAAQSSLKWIAAGGALIGGVSLLSVIQRVTRATQESMAAQAQLAAVLKSTSEAAGMSQEQINDLSKSLANNSIFSADEITQGATHLLA